MNELTYIHFGFEVEGKLYGWKNKKLYKLPEMRELKLQLFNYSKGYWINRKPYCMAKLKTITTEIRFNAIDLNTPSWAR